MDYIKKHQQSIKDNISKSFNANEFDLEQIFTLEQISKGVEIYTPESIKRFQNDLKKSFSDRLISSEELEKAMKDLSRLAMRQIIDKNGHKKIVYVKVHVDEKGNSKKEVDHQKGDTVKFTKDGKERTGKIHSLKFNDKTDKVGTATVDVDGVHHSVSLSKLEKQHGDEQNNIIKNKKENRGISQDTVQKMKNLGHNSESISDFIDEYHQGGSKLPSKIRDILGKDIEGRHYNPASKEKNATVDVKEHTLNDVRDFIKEERKSGQSAEQVYSKMKQNGMDKKYTYSGVKQHYEDLDNYERDKLSTKENITEFKGEVNLGNISNAIKKLSREMSGEQQMNRISLNANEYSGSGKTSGDIKFISKENNPEKIKSLFKKKFGDKLKVSFDSDKKIFTATINKNDDESDAKEDKRTELTQPIYGGKKSLPNNIADWLKGHGSHLKSDATKVNGWLHSLVGRNFSGGTAIGKNYDTLVLDITHQGSEVYINGDGSIKVNGVAVNSKKEFETALKTKFKLPSEMKKGIDELSIKKAFNKLGSF